jgi:hypothetical protein
MKNEIKYESQCAEMDLTIALGYTGKVVGEGERAIEEMSKAKPPSYSPSDLEFEDKFGSLKTVVIQFEDEAELE